MQIKKKQLATDINDIYNITYAFFLMNIGWSKYCKRPYSRNETAKGEKKQGGSNLHFYRNWKLCLWPTLQFEK